MNSTGVYYRLMGKKVKKFVASRKFFWLVVIVFVLQGIWFAGSLKYSVPPDESYHFTFTTLYTQEPISHGPFISHEPENYLLFLGDVQQTPSFLYHYTMSFALRLFSHLISNVNHQLVALRLIDVGIGALSIIVLDRIFRKIKASVFVSNLALAMFVSTGMFVWISSAVNYDSMSMLSWFLLLLSVLRLQEKMSLDNILLVVLFSISTVIIKVTYAPVILALLLTYLFINRKRLNKLVGAIIPRSLSKRTILLIITCIAVCGLALSRVGFNLVRYHSVAPSCQAVHSVSACSESTALQRDRQVHESFLQFKRAGGYIDFNPLTFAGDWSDKMYQRLFFYFGYKTMVPNTGAEAVLAMASIFIVCLFLTKKTKLVETDKEMLLVMALAFYVSALFLLNYHSYMTTGTQSGYQGRYLLPIIPIAYIFTLKLIQQTYKRLPSAKQPLLVAVCLIFLLAFMYEDFPGLVFLKGTDVSWYSDPTSSINLKLKHAMTKSHLFHGDQLRTQ